MQLTIKGLNLEVPTKRPQWAVVKSPIVREVMAEFLGTFILTMLGNSVVASLTLGRAGKLAIVAGPLGWGLALFFAVLVAGPISGGHVNPAVSVSLAAIGKFPLAKVAHYVVAQYLGAFMGAVLVYWIYIDGIEQFDGGIRSVLPEASATAHIFATFPQPHVGTGAAFLDQLMGTALLLVAVRAAQSAGGHLQAASVIGAALTAIGLGLSHNCMGALNPARDLAPRVFAAMAGWGAPVFSVRGYNWFWVPVLGPHLGGLLGVLVFHVFATASPRAKSSRQDSVVPAVSLDDDKLEGKPGSPLPADASVVVPMKESS